MDRTIEVFDDSEDSYDLGDSDVFFELFAKPHGTSLEVINTGDPTTNQITFTNSEVINYRPGIYYHECYQMTDESPSTKILLFYGVSEVI